MAILSQPISDLQEYLPPVGIQPVSPSQPLQGMATPTATITATNMQPLTLPTAGFPIPTSAPVPQAATSIDGSQFVATTTPEQPGSQFSPVNVVSGIAGQLGTGAPTTAAGDAIGALRNQFRAPVGVDPTALATQSLDQILSGDNPYIRNAARRGMERAGARGLLNSSIAGGAATRSAIEASMPIFQEAMGLTRQREQQAFSEAQGAFEAASRLTGQDRQNAFANAQNLLNQAYDMQGRRESQAFQAQESQLARTQDVNNQLLASQLRAGDKIEDARVTDWLNSQDFSRKFSGQLSMLPITSAIDLTNAITQYAIQDPELYTPQVVSGMTEFFNRNMLAIMQQYFPTTTGGTP